MGNNGSNEVTVEKDGIDFIQTGDGIKLSANLVERLTSPESNVNEGRGNAVGENDVAAIKESQTKTKEAIKLAEECQIMLEEREKQMLELSEKWQADLENERAKHKKFYDISLEEFERSVKEVEQKFRKPTLKPVCQNLQDLLVECYKSNPGKVLNCSQHVKNFKKCVDDTKDAYLAKTKASGA